MLIRSLNCALWFLATGTHAQVPPDLFRIQTDGSLGPAQLLSGPDHVIPESLGRRAGNNLFHSFSEFNIKTGESATFTGASEIANVISRVTGGRISTLDGLLKCEIEDANFYLINSAGILFGPNASLSINGSFHTSTADYIRLGEGNRFYSEPLQGEILSTAAPAAFGFFGAAKRGITVRGSQLALEEGKTLSLVGGEVIVEDGARIHVLQGQINLVSVNSEGEAAFDIADGYQDLDVGAFEQLGSVKIKASELNVDGEGGGRVVIRGGQLALSDGTVSARTTGDRNGKGVDMAADQLRFVRSRIDTTTAGSGNAGDVLMVANALVLNGVDGPEGVGVFAGSTEAAGNAGTITMTADQVDVRGNPDIEATAQLPADNGTIHLSTSTLKWNGFDAEFRVNSGKGELIRLGSGNIILDGSLNPDLDGVALDGPAYLIESDMGQTAGNNLFHSFEVLFVDEGETATFAGPESISNIIARVSGDTMTSIYGQLISDIPGADLYLINPNGLFFGASARLNLSGSFHFGTADYLTLTNGGRFDASISAESKLNDGTVSAYGFIDNDIGDIALESAVLILQDNEVFSLIGGNLNLRDESRLITFSGQVNLVSLQSAGEASVSAGGKDVDISGFSELGDSLVDNSAVNVKSSSINSPVGRIFLRSDDLMLDNDGEFRARNFGQEVGGSVDVLISGDFFIGKDSAIEVSGTGALGQVSVVAENITIDGTGQEGFTGLDVSQDGTGNENGDNLKVTVAQTLNLINGGVIDVANFSAADGFKSTIQAKNLIIDDQKSNDFTGIFSATQSQGNGGELEITVEELLQISNEGFINSSTYSAGKGGKITVRTKNLTIDSRSSIVSASVPGVLFDAEESTITGDGGELDIIVEEQLRISNGSRISSSTFSSGNAGNINIRAKDLIIDGQGSGFDSGIFSSTLFDSTGDAGDLDIVAEETLQIDSGAITASAEIGNAGNLSISAGSDIRIENSRISISAGQADFDVNDLDNFSQPELVIEAGNSIRIQNSTLSTNAGVLGSGRGAGGDIYLLAPKEIRLQNSALLAQAGYAGGNVFIDPTFYIVNNSDVIAQADIQGGNYSVIVTEPFGWIQSADSLIDLSGEQSGSVLSNTSPFDLGAELSDLNPDFLNAEDWAVQPCKLRSGGAGSSFVVTGWRGASNNPDDFLPSEPILLADYNCAEMEPVDDKELLEAMFPRLDDDCDDCP